MPFLAPILFLVTLFASSLTLANNNLPTLGNASSNIISIEKERQLGNAWLAALRGQVQTYEQPVVEQYLEQLVYSLAPYSAVADREFRFVVLNSPELNAFAVPGSVVGINAGLFLHASSEQEFASVIAHELAHLSQRHYARRLEQQQLSTPLTLAGVLASVVIAATTGAEAGIATLASTQALSVEKSLSYSRQNEEEADRIGIETMYASDYNPRAMPKMFERMLKNARLQGNTPPEYLSTHPLSENRVSDTRNRAEQYPVKPYQDSVLFHICKAIVTVDYAQSKEQAADLYKSIISRGKHKNVDAARFGLAYALLESDPSFSLKTFEELHTKYPGTIAISIFLAEAEYSAGKKQDAFERLKQLLEFNPNNYPSALLLAELYDLEKRYAEAENILIKLTRAQEDNPLVWYMLSEIHGQAGNIVGLRQARAQFFILTGRYDQAIEQLQLGIKIAKPNSRLASIMKGQLDRAYDLKENPPF
ncbi:hypothetical protein A3742_12400 [Oleiphilus sp. HI0071]|nr:hypothetical protein A3737_00720 [Oleiphilus sp. HI0065]KZY80856.1 hypothetical protein A3742_12400 [Oleiphilus sp. HI0071]KZY91217.1 hypothetical protein A3744_04995 [Oleiphilus sp. HI0073]KZZ42240.1 hypothetical protein A3758_06640 [Oleiphilus sp. HI0118]KZZ60313.1 hypothetical protein A3760_05430 [Oleiphilus sp. HI0122]KZZ73309.1 hypothetical protein A3765_12570 [Oleiphilus sp. HI0130]KZZ82044.1 hypothetical protein A3767_06000 [Oleiphilus sp. HI0133]